jgi:hypothetical protein
MKCDHCGCEIGEQQATSVSRVSPTGTINVALCSGCSSPGRVTMSVVINAVILFLLALGLILLLGYLIT